MCHNRAIRSRPLSLCRVFVLLLCFYSLLIVQLDIHFDAQVHIYFRFPLPHEEYDILFEAAGRHSIAHSLNIGGI